MPTLSTAPPPAAPPPPPPTDKPPADYMADIIGELEQMDAPAPPPEPKPKKADKPVAKPPETKAPAAEPKPEKDAEKPPETPPKPAAEEPPKPVKAAELRTAYETLKKRFKEEYEPELQRTKAKLQELEAKVATVDEPAKQSLEKLQSNLKQVEQRNEELENRIRYVDYTRSKEFVTKYQQPYRDAWNEAVTEFRELSVREPAGEDENGDPKFTTRPADENDLLRLANMRLAEMDETATRIFGASAPRAISHIQNLKKLSSAQAKALEDAEKRSKEWYQDQESQAQNSQKSRAAAWLEINKALEDRFPKAFKPDDADAEDKTAHTKGFALTDLMFHGPKGITPEQVEALPAGFRDAVKSGQPLTEEQNVKLHSLVRLKAANHDRQVAALKKAQARIAELEKSLAEFEKSEPGGGRLEPAPKPGDKDWLEQAEQELKSMDK